MGNCCVATVAQNNEESRKLAEMTNLEVHTYNRRLVTEAEDDMSLNDFSVSDIGEALDWSPKVA